MLNLKDISLPIEHDFDELYTIGLYCGLNWGSQRFDKETLEKHWFNYQYHQRNPNESGIAGEWAFWKRHNGGLLSNFLQNRPRRRPDTGDGVTNDGMTFDIKTKCWKYPIEAVFNKDYFKADINAPDFDAHPNIGAFAFVYFDIVKLKIYLVGWLDRERLKEHLDFHPKGEARDNGFPYPADTYHVRYQVLDPMFYLCQGGVSPIT